jgi:shikimate dehydrogenase
LVQFTFERTGSVQNMSHAAPRYAVFGNPISHSRSPEIHHAFAAQAKIAITYERILAPLDTFADALARFRREGGVGCNVTLPFKAQAAALAVIVSERVRLSGAANTLYWQGERLAADNTDGLGLVNDLERYGVPLNGETVMMLGAGGAAAGVLGSLFEAGVARILIVNRTLANAQALVDRHAKVGRCVAYPMTAVPRSIASAVIINASSAALVAEQTSPLDDAIVAKTGFAYDMVYGKATSFLTQAARLGVSSADGLGMLVEQAASAFALWHGVRPATEPVLRALRDEMAGH